jgi:hypothetical protein
LVRINQAHFNRRDAGLSQDEFSKPARESGRSRIIWRTWLPGSWASLSCFAAVLASKPCGSKSCLSGKSEEEINDLIYRQHAALPLAEVMHEFREAHQQMLAALDEIGDEDLLKPYAAYVPGGVDNPEKPVVNWIISNTYRHFDEHLGYILRILQESEA